MEAQQSHTRPGEAGGAGPDARVPVYAMWDATMGPLLSLGMLTANARSWDGGRLTTAYDVHRPETIDEVLAHLAGRSGPAVLLSSNYVWSIDTNLAAARRALELEPELVIIHGGPSTPKYEADAERFLADHADVARILVHGEGEETLCHLLDALASTVPDLDDQALRSVEGITFRAGDGAIVRTADRPRIADLDTLPSPYLTGEFDHLDAAAWGLQPFNIETNRGCPYGCTYCDWGSATLARVRRFDVDRVAAEFRWAAERGILNVHFCDANFGIFARDVEIAERAAATAHELGYPVSVAFAPAKNTGRHLAKIFDHLMGAGILVSAAISLQTIDPDTLDAVDRSNISTDAYLALAADLRRRGQPLLGDLIIGMPGQTYEAYRQDLQFFLDHEIMARSWTAKLLPNAPMNAPDYRDQYGIEVDGTQVVQATSTMSSSDRARMLRLRSVEIIAERVGVLRHVMRFVQWDHGVAATELMERILATIETDPTRFPHLTWVFSYFDRRPTSAAGWAAFYQEVRSLVVEDLGLDPADPGLDTVLRLQEFLMPAPGRRFPAEITLAHDYVAYYRSATDELFTTGKASTPTRPLHEHRPATFRVEGDPLSLCSTGAAFDGDSSDEVIEGDFQLGGSFAYELDSPLLQLRTVMGGRGSPVDGPARAAARVASIDWDGPIEPALGARLSSDRLRIRTKTSEPAP